MPLLRVALTGGIATGKSYCATRFRVHGIPVVDADALAREAVAAGTPGLAAVVRRFGGRILMEDGSLDRARLGAIIFGDRALRADLEAIIHPEVYRRINEWFVLQPRDVPCAIADIPLLFETGHEHDFDRVVVAICDPAEQVRRLMHRDGLTREGALARIATQWPTEEKAARAHYVIRTDGSYAETEAQVGEVVERLKAEG